MTHRLPGLTLADVCVLDDTLQPVYNTYGPNTGVVIEPQSPFVMRRLQELVGNFTTLVPCDGIFQDQIGARPWLADYSPLSGSLYAYMANWINQTLSHSATGTVLMTEQGYDLLVGIEAGFHGSVLLAQYSYGDQTNGWWGDSNWYPFPLAPMMARPNVLFYQHNLDTTTYTVDLFYLSWNMAFGYQLSQDALTIASNLTWLQAVVQMQNDVLGLFAYDSVLAFDVQQYNSNSQATVTTTVFADHTVLFNQNTDSTWSIDSSDICANGFLLTSSTVTAAAYCGAMNGVALSDGIQILIAFVLNATAVQIAQPWGTTTPVGVDVPFAASQASVVAVTSTGAQLPTASSAIGANTIAFTYSSSLDAQSIVHYIATSRT